MGLEEYYLEWRTAVVRHYNLLKERNPNHVLVRMLELTLDGKDFEAVPEFYDGCDIGAEPINEIFAFSRYCRAVKSALDGKPFRLFFVCNQKVLDSSAD